jgi:hypothetical protein
MRKNRVKANLSSLALAALLLLAPGLPLAQATETKPGSPPVAQPLISEGEFALTLASGLSLPSNDDEVAAESALGDLGIAPRNGWIADYPVTPDIVAELQDSVGSAADAGKLPIGKTEALKQLNAAAAEFGLTVRPYATGTTYEPSPSSCENYPNPNVIYHSYSTEGPPIVTYYCPPPDYYNLYGWVPYPFWWGELWFPGFFILHDFHRVVHHHHKVVVLTNHFNESRSHRAFRIDPVERFRGKTFAGIGVSHPKAFIQTGVPRSERTLFNGPRASRSPARVPAGQRSAPAPRSGERMAPSPGGMQQRK